MIALEVVLQCWWTRWLHSL